MDDYLSDIRVKNLALFTDISAEFKPGLNVISGETGSGKTLLLDALQLALGKRADYDQVSNKKASIVASLTITNTPDSLTEYKSDSQFVCRRILTTSNNTRSYLNDDPVPLKTLRTLRKASVDFHGQHDNQVVFESGYPIKVLDRYGNYSSQLDSYQDQYKEYKRTQKELSELKEEDQNDKLSLIKYQLDELDDFQPESKEWEKIEEKREKYEAYEERSDALKEIDTMLSVKDGAPREVIERMRTRIEKTFGHDSEWGEWSDALADIKSELSEMSRFVSTKLNQQDYSEEDFQKLMKRRKKWLELSRKHDINPDNLYSFYEQLKQKEEKYNQYEKRINELKEKIESLRNKLEKKANKLHQKRLQTAKKLQKEVTEQFPKLMLDGCQFSISISSKDNFNRKGNSDVQWQFSSHNSQDLGPLKKRISGGEASRVLLAIKKALAEADATPILIFDEIDTGISGKEADSVGQVLKSLAQHHQVICITHLPLIAAYGDHHIKIKRDENKDGVNIKAKNLSEEKRVAELSRMIAGGQEKVTKKQAREMLSERK